MVKYEDFKKRNLKDPEVKTAYDDFPPDIIIQGMIDTEKVSILTQKDLLKQPA